MMEWSCWKTFTDNIWPAKGFSAWPLHHWRIFFGIFWFWFWIRRTLLIFEVGNYKLYNFMGLVAFRDGDNFCKAFSEAQVFAKIVPIPKNYNFEKENKSENNFFQKNNPTNTYFHVINCSFWHMHECSCQTFAKIVPIPKSHSQIANP